MSDIVRIGEVPQSEPPPPPLPELQDALLGPGELDALLADLASLAEGLEIILKGAATERAIVGRDPTLDDARAMLESGAVRGVQLRYSYEGTTWWDTLLRTPAGVRIVRIEAPVQG